MKKIMLIVVIALMVFLVSCSPPTKNYLAQMDELEEPTAFQARTLVIEETIWVTHMKLLNENETLYYAPEKVTVDGMIYLNDKEMFFIVQMDPSLLTNYEEINKEQLKLIFED